MTLHIVEIRGRSMWWTWMIRDSAGVLLEESRTQFRSAEAAELQGRNRIAQSVWSAASPVRPPLFFCSGGHAFCLTRSGEIPLTPKLF